MLGLPFIAVMPASHQPGEDRADRVLWRALPPGRRPDAGGRRSRGGLPRRPAAISWTSSPTPSARPTGAATTTSPSRSSARWRGNATRCPAGSSSARAPAAPARPSAGTCSYRRLHDPSLRRGSGELSVLPRLGEPRPRLTTGRGSRIEGIGRPRVELSFMPEIVDRMIRVPDAASIAAMRLAGRAYRPPGRRLHRHEPMGRVPDRLRAACRRRPRLGGEPAVRRRRALSEHVLRRWLAPVSGY